MCPLEKGVQRLIAWEHAVPDSFDVVRVPCEVLPRGTRRDEEHDTRDQPEGRERASCLSHWPETAR